MPRSRRRRASMGPLVHQYRITLLGITPSIWRRIQVPAHYTFWDLHVAIQDAMGWNDSHLHHFEVRPKHSHRPTCFGIPFEDDEDSQRPEAGWKHCAADFITLERPVCEYLYDFGDSWRHQVELEGILRAVPGIRYPTCIAGERASPPDDCGGSAGYEQLLEIISDVAHPEHRQTREWLRSMKQIAGDFDPQAFEPGLVRFDNPIKRLKIASDGQIG